MQLRPWMHRVTFQDVTPFFVAWMMFQEMGSMEPATTTGAEATPESHPTGTGCIQNFAIGAAVGVVFGVIRGVVIGMDANRGGPGFAFLGRHVVMIR